MWLLAPAGAFAYLTAASSEARLAEHATVWSPIRANSGDVRERVGIALTWSSGTPVVAPAWEGLVESVKVAPGTPLNDGDVVAEISGITRRAFAASAALYRPLAADDRGSDVAALRSWLSARGYAATPGERVDWSTLLAIRKYASDVGVPGVVDAFEPGWVVWLPASAIQVAEVALTPGAPAPPPGEQIITPARALSAATLTSDTTATATRAEGPGADAEPGSPQAADDAGVPSGDRLTAAPNQHLVVGNTKLELAEDRASLTPAGLAALTQLVSPDAQKVVGALTAPAEKGQFTVPADAVYTNANGQSCVTTRTRGGEPRPLRVAIVSQSIASLVITGELSTTDQVAVAPEAKDRRCE